MSRLFQLNSFEMVYIKLLLIFHFMLVLIIAYPQVSSDQLKATLILHLCENVDWDKPLSEDFKIGYLSDQKNILQQLKPVEGKIKLHEKNVKIIQSNSYKDLLTCQAIYYNRENYRDISTLLEVARSNNILLITDDYGDQLFVFIDLAETSGKIGFKVNIPNLTLAGLTVKPNLLLNGGSVVDIKSAYQNFEKQLEQNSDKLNSTIKRLEQVESQLSKSDQVIQKKDQIILKRELEVNRISYLADSLSLLSQLLNLQVQESEDNVQRRATEILVQNSQLRKIQDSIGSKQDELTKVNDRLSQLKITADTLRTEIVKRDDLLSVRNQLISSQKRILLLTIGLILMLIIGTFGLYRLFHVKKRHNLLLEEKVALRTEELKLSNEQYLSLFHNTPVATWEADFSKVKSYMNSLNLQNDEAYENYILEHPDFGIECIRKIEFININQAALNLYDIEKKEQMAALYEDIYRKSGLTGLNFELKMIFKNKNYHSYEAERSNKKGEKLDLVFKWLDISEKSGSYSRLILTLEDVSHIRKIEKELRHHQENLEVLIKEKTNDLEEANIELIGINSELLEKSEIISIQNIELTHALNELRDTQGKLLQSEKMASLGILTAGVAHEINNPLNYIMGAYQGLKMYHEDTTGAMNESHVKLSMEALKIGVERATNIVKSLNQFSRDSKTQNEDCNIQNIIENCLIMLNNQFKDVIEIETNFVETNQLVIGNVGNLHQAFINILSNAIQSIEKKGSISITTQLKKSNIVVLIKDTGKGIPKENLTKITDPFFTTKAPGIGTGLGLSITYNIIKDHHGILEYDSIVDKGTTVRVILPVNMVNSKIENLL